MEAIATWNTVNEVASELIACVDSAVLEPRSGHKLVGGSIDRSIAPCVTRDIHTWDPNPVGIQQTSEYVVRGGVYWCFLPLTPSSYILGSRVRARPRVRGGSSRAGALWSVKHQTNKEFLNHSWLFWIKWWRALTTRTYNI